MNVISMAGMLSAGGLAMSPYEVSKNAAEALTDGLRLEMIMFGVDVIAVNLSFHKTPLVAGARRRLEDLWDELIPKVKEEYGQDFFDIYADHAQTMFLASQWDFKVVVDSIVQAI
jgi:NAD(P)-dependent dehydrogenase (short-subunit alcohol dehydrogenase family)